MRAYKLLLSLAVFSSMFAVGCSSIAHSEFDIAWRLQKRGRVQLAARLYQAALERIPADDRRWRSQAMYRLGQCFWDSGRIADAIAQFQGAAETDGSNILARLRLGAIMLAGGAPERASEQAMAVLRGSFANTDALALLGAASSETGQDLFAEAAFRQVLEREPGRVNIAIALADLLNRRDRPEDAREVLRNSADNSASASPLIALGRLEEQEGHAAEAEQAYRQAAAREDTPDVNLRLAQFLERSSQVEEAQKILARVDRMRPGQATALPDFELLAGRALLASQRYMEAMRLKRVNEPAQHGSSRGADSESSTLAARIIEADLQSAREQNDSAQAMAVVHLHMQQYRSQLDTTTIAILEAELALTEKDISAAQQHSTAAVELAPESPVAHYVLGLVRYHAGESGQARDAWLNAIQQDENFAPARLALTYEALRVGDALGAEQYVVPVVREEPANILALCLYARVLLAQNRFAGATVIANRALAVNTSSAEPRVLLGQIASAQRRYAEALVQFERALLQEPGSIQALDGLVGVYRTGSITHSMLRRMEMVSAAPPRSAVLMELAGRLYAQGGWSSDARRCLQQAWTMDPRRSSAAAVLARLLAREGDGAAAAWAQRTGGYPAALVSGFNAQQHHDIATAIAQYEAAVREGEHTGVAANNLAWLYAQQGKSLDRALSLAERARSLAPGNPAVLDTVGFVHLCRREYSQAIDVLKGAASLAVSPEYAGHTQLVTDIRRHLSEAYTRAGLPSQAAAVQSGMLVKPADFWQSPD